MLAYGIPADLIDDHLAMGESIAIKCVKRFVVAIVQVFGATYLRAPNAEDTARLLLGGLLDFGILQAQFAIVRGPARFWDQECL
jgi:hypothetical protein